MTDRLPNSPGKYSAVVAGGELQKMQTGKPFAIHLQLDDDPVREGTPYSKAAVLPDELAAKLCPETEDPAPKDALRGLWKKKADSIRSKSGTVIAIEDSAHAPLKGMKLFGKTIQDGTPTPTAPVELESVGASGNIGCKNYLPKTEYTAEDNGSSWFYFIKSTDPFPTLEAGDYILSFDSPAAFSGAPMTINFYGATGTIVSKGFTATATTTVEVTLPSEATGMQWASRVAGTVTNVMLIKSGSGKIGVTVAGKNLFPKASAGVLTQNGITFTSNGDGSYSVKGTASGEVTLYFPLEENCVLIEGAYLHCMNSVNASGSTSLLYQFSDGTSSYWGLGPVNRIAAPSKNFGKTITKIGINVKSGYTADFTISPMFVFSNTATNFEPYKPTQTLTANKPNGLTNTPNGLPGIPVSSGGNYTDESGQAWICDEIDFARGVYMQRVVKKVLTGENGAKLTGTSSLRSNLYGAENFTDIVTPTNNITAGQAISSHYVIDTWTAIANSSVFSKFGIHLNGSIGFAFDGTIDEANSWLREQNANGTPVTMLCILKNPIPTDLSAEELAAYAALHTNKPNTTVMNDAGAGMEIAYYTPTTAVQMVHSPADVGKILSIDEHGCVVLTEQKDRIVEQGVSGIWTYRKWDSGIAECWGNITNTFDSTSFGNYPVWSDFYTVRAEKQLPFAFKDNDPTINVSIRMGSNNLTHCIPNRATYVSATQNVIEASAFVYHASDVARSYEVTFGIHAIGRWK